MPRAKRSPERSDEMRSALVAAARAAIAANGIGSVTARGLASELGWSVGAIYTVAPSIDAVTLLANAAELADLERALLVRRRALGPTAPTESVLRAYAAEYLAFAAARPKSWAAIFERDAEGEPPPWYRRRQMRLFAILEEALRPAAETPDAGKRAAKMLWAALHGLLALFLAGHLDRAAGDLDVGCAAGDVDRVPELAAHAEELIDLFMAGLAARTRSAPVDA